MCHVNLLARYPESGVAYRAARQGTGISQKRLAEQVGISRRHYIKFENGDHRPMPELRDRIASALNIDPSSLPAAGREPPFAPSGS